MYTWGDSDVILSIVNAAILEVHYVAAVERRKLEYACNTVVICISRNATSAINLGVRIFRFPHFNSR